MSDNKKIENSLAFSSKIIQIFILNHFNDIKNYHFSMKICMLHLCILVSIMDIFILYIFKAVESRRKPSQGSVGFSL